MIHPRTSAEDYLAFDRERKYFAQVASLEKRSYEEFLKGMKEIEERYKGRVFPEDTFLFDSYEAFERFALENGLERKMGHEKDHGRKAEELGYTVTYGFSFYMDILGDSYCKPFIRIKEMPIPAEHMKQIISAPERPSRTDNSLLDFIRKIEGR